MQQADNAPGPAGNAPTGTHVKRFKMGLRNQQQLDAWRLSDPIPEPLFGHNTIGPAATALVRHLHEGRRRKWAGRAGNPDG